jgi:hypothetical protein
MLLFDYTRPKACRDMDYNSPVDRPESCTAQIFSDAVSDSGIQTIERLREPLRIDAPGRSANAELKPSYNQCMMNTNFGHYRVAQSLLQNLATHV